jgi:hypothetical protein
MVAVLNENDKRRRMKGLTRACLVFLAFATIWPTLTTLLTTVNVANVANGSGGAGQGTLMITQDGNVLATGTTAGANKEKSGDCVLPRWVDAGAEVMADEIFNGSMGLTDKVRNGHEYEFMYYPYMSNMIRTRYCSSPTTSITTTTGDSDNDTQPPLTPKITMLEIGLGCAPDGGMLQSTPGGSAMAWRHLFGDKPQNFELHLMEFDGECALKWAANHTHVAHVHVGDASSPEDLDRVVQAAGGGSPFDIIIDDGSHINWHQIKTLEYLISKLRPGGFYVVEDIHSACYSWKANMGASTSTRKGDQTGGTWYCTDLAMVNQQSFQKFRTGKSSYSGE